MMNWKSLFQQSIEKWGIESQLLMLAEELDELGVATLHLLRKNRNRSEPERLLNLLSFAEEIADVEFMLEEMKYHFKNEGKIAEFRKKKEKYLERLLKE